MKLEGSTAESLEQRDLCHRSAHRWLTVMDNTGDDTEREMIASRRTCRLSAVFARNQEDCIKCSNGIEEG
ncbi:PerC family transcriptional regulator [Pantoea allii]|uniref:PerC family transcriptional regulator n=1 Tax=Pantoea allii TaxID=574096 RepID=A0ABS6VB45_9GAMM|nr:PerC family transcriptional regulator [Pantoea allii]MBW1256526.1 PerC family transcriptional regulator [Pantoea allii]MBW1265828.1 PerC family transcriptional regulator [Pantoea allii]MBW1287720.1 PerC family transcriptional regulator [Pantoea allii]